MTNWYKTTDFCRNCLIGADICAFLLAYLLGGGLFYLVRAEVLDSLGLAFGSLLSDWSIYYLPLIPFALMRFWYAGHYTRRRPFWDELREVLQVLSVLFIAEGALLFLAKSSFSRLWMTSAFGFALVLLPALRILTKKILHAAGKWQLPTVVIGTGENAVDAISALESEPLLGFQVQCAFSLEPDSSNGNQPLIVNHRSIPVRSLGDDPMAAIREFGMPRILFAPEGGGIRGSMALIEELHRNFSDIYIAPALGGLPLYGTEVNTFFRHEVLLLRVRNILSRRMPRLLKRSFDLIGAGVLILVLTPLLLYLGWKVRRDGSTALYAHQRIGHYGRPFACLKFRSMVVDADRVLNRMLENDPALQQEWQQDFKLKEDPRVTPIGEFLRRTSLDELPQLWNVVRGEMSLVGPRPIVAEEVEKYGKNIHYYYSVRPGMTGLWQISGRSDTDYTDRVYLDTWYVKNWTLWTDIVILLKTVKVVFQRQGAY